ncbi:MAG: hypothetical protein ABIK86_00655 [candidate division WOR-3 bacterium]
MRNTAGGLARELGLLLALLLGAMLAGCGKGRQSEARAKRDRAAAEVASSDSTAGDGAEVAGTAIDSALAEFISAQAPAWVRRSAERIPGFAPSKLRMTSQREYQLEWRDPDEPIPRAEREARLVLRQKMGFLSFSPDSSRYVDLDGYAGIVVSDGDTEVLREPDQLVQLVESGTGRTARIRFHGTASRTEKVLWLDDSTLVLLNQAEEYAVQGPTSIVPEVEVFDLANGMVIAFRLPIALFSKEQ